MLLIRLIFLFESMVGLFLKAFTLHVAMQIGLYLHRSKSASGV